MRRLRSLATVAAAGLLLLFALPSSCPWDSAVAYEEVLSCDDGDSDWQYAQGWEGCRHVAKYEAPEWANWLVGAQYCVGYFNEFYLIVIGPSESSPAPGDSVQYVQLVPDMGDAQSRFDWLEVRLEEPVQIRNSGAFPGGVFFVGAEWIHYLQPWFALDMVAPVHGCTWHMTPGNPWQHYTIGDVMIRAIVSDTIGTPVGGATWSAVKALYR